MAKSVPTQIINLVFEKLPSGVLTAMDERSVHENAGANRVIGIKRGSVIRETEKPGGDLRLPDGKRNPKWGRRLYTRDFKIDWVIHGVGTNDGEDDDHAAEQLLLNLILAVRNVAHGSVLLGAETWTDQQDDADGFERWGSRIDLETTFKFPIYEAEGKLVMLTANPAIVTTYTLNATEGIT